MQADAELLVSLQGATGWWAVTRVGQSYMRERVAAWGTFQTPDGWTVRALVAGVGPELVGADDSSTLYHDSELPLCDCDLSPARQWGVDDPCWCRKCGGLLDCSGCRSTTGVAA